MQNDIINVTNSCTVLLYEEMTGKRGSYKFFFFTLPEFSDAFSRNVLEKYPKDHFYYPSIEIKEIKIVDPLEQGIYEAELSMILTLKPLSWIMEPTKTQTFKAGYLSMDELIPEINQFLRDIQITLAKSHACYYSLEKLSLKVV